MARVPANSGNYLPFPLDEIFIAKITAVKDQPPPEDHPEWTPALNVEFTVIEGEFTDRKTWRNFPQTWPTEDKVGTTLLFDLVTAFAPAAAIKGSELDSDVLLSKVGRIQMENKVIAKGADKGKPVLDTNGNQRQQPKSYYPLKTSAGTAEQRVINGESATATVKVGTKGKVGF